MISSFIHFLVFIFFRPSKVKVHDLEHKCRTQSEQCNILSKELEKYHLASDREEKLYTDRPEQNVSRVYESLQRQADKSEFFKQLMVYFILGWF